MKCTLLILALLIYHPAIAQVIAPISYHGGDIQSIKIGYLVAITSHSDGLNITKTTDLTDVYTLAEIHFPNNCVDFIKELRYSVYYEIESQHKGFYVEVKKINRKGKFRRMSNREFKTINMQYSISNNQ